MTGHEFDVLNYINLHEIGRTDQIASNLQISESTVRRMLDKLEQKGLVVQLALVQVKGQLPGTFVIL